MGSAVQLRNCDLPLCGRFDGAAPAFDAEAVDTIEAHWMSRLQANPRLVRGSVLWLRHLEVGQRHVDLHFGLSDYAHYLYTLDNPGASVTPCRVAYTSALLLTTDGFAVFGERAPWTSAPRQLQCAGGGLSLADVAGDMVDIRHNIATEISEELNLSMEAPALALSLQRPTFIKTGGRNDFLGLIHVVQVPMSLAGVQQRHAQLPESEREFARLVGVRPVDVADFSALDDRPRVDYLIPLLQAIASTVDSDLRPMGTSAR